MTSLNYLDRIKELFYNPKTMGSAEKLYKILRNERYVVTLNDVKDFLKKQESVITTTKNTIIIYPPITSNVSAYQADLMFLDKFERHNSGFHIVFCFIEVTSRKAFCYPLKLKNENVINEKYEEFLKGIKYDIVTLNTDNGSEFISKSFTAINQKYNINHYFVQVGDHTKQGKVERFNRTIRSKITTYMTSNNTLNWVSVIDDLVENYNSSVHSSIGIEPNNVNEKIKNKIRKGVQKRKKKSFRVHKHI
jgi:IS30 family transposase